MIHLIVIGALATVAILSQTSGGTVTGSGDVDAPDDDGTGNILSGVTATLGGLVSTGSNNPTTWSDACLQLNRLSEGCRLKAYPDAAGYSIGWGHYGVAAGTVWTQDQADAQEVTDLNAAAAIINNNVAVDLTQAQFDALTDFVYNVGGGQFLTSHMFAYLNQGDFTSASNEFPRWIYSKKVVDPSLVTRRQREQALFNSQPTASQLAAAAGTSTDDSDLSSGDDTNSSDDYEVTWA